MLLNSITKPCIPIYIQFKLFANYMSPIQILQNICVMETGSAVYIMQGHRLQEHKCTTDLCQIVELEGTSTVHYGDQFMSESCHVVISNNVNIAKQCITW